MLKLNTKFSELVMFVVENSNTALRQSRIRASTRRPLKASTSVSSATNLSMQPSFNSGSAFIYYSTHSR